MQTQKRNPNLQARLRELAVRNNIEDKALIKEVKNIKRHFHKLKLAEA